MMLLFIKYDYPYLVAFLLGMGGEGENWKGHAVDSFHIGTQLSCRMVQTDTAVAHQPWEVFFIQKLQVASLCVRGIADELDRPCLLDFIATRPPKEVGVRK
jgi:hypothetical protein